LRWGAKFTEEGKKKSRQKVLRERMRGVGLSSAEGVCEGAAAEVNKGGEKMQARSILAGGSG